MTIDRRVVRHNRPAREELSRWVGRFRQEAVHREVERLVRAAMPDWDEVVEEQL